ncbi:MAG: cysteine desulfurase NifS [Clostridia bacterium]|nr:cysteine desulfurase NifS [Clostridia bacterium]
MYIYADNAATTKISRRAAQAMLTVMEGNWGNPSSLHSAGQRAKDLLETARANIASAIGALPQEIYFTSGGSEADNQAIVSAAALGERKGKRHIITTAFEHHAVLHTVEKLRKSGFTVTYLDVHEDGIVRPEEVEAAITDETCLVSVMYANNEIGTIQPVRQIGEICRRHGVLFHTDAVQAVGHIPVNVKEENIDLLSLSAHKFHGPKGVGVLYAKKGIRLTGLIEGGAQEKGKRAGTENLPGIAGMAAALTEACENMEKNMAHLTSLRDRLIGRLEEIPHASLSGHRENRLPSNVHFCFEGIEGESLLLMLDDRGVAASSGSACTSGSLDPSHVLLAIGKPHEIAHGSLRLSLSEDMTEADVDAIAEAVTDVVRQLREMSPVWRDLQEGKREYMIA